MLVQPAVITSLEDQPTNTMYAPWLAKMKNSGRGLTV